MNTINSNLSTFAKIAQDVQLADIVSQYGGDVAKLINWCIAHNITTPAQARAYVRRIDNEGSIEAVNLSRVMSDGYAIQGEEPKLNGCDAQARRAYHAALEAGETHPLVNQCAYEKSSAYGEKGASTGHGEEMPIEVFEAFAEMYSDIETLEDLRQALAQDGIESCVDAYSFVEGHEATDSALDADRDMYLAGEETSVSIERKCDALTKSSGRVHGEFHGLAAFRAARFEALVRFIARCNNVSHLEGKGGLERGVYSRYQAARNLNRPELSYLTWAQVQEISRLVAARKVRIARCDWRNAAPLDAMRTSRAKRKASGVVETTAPLTGECLDFRPVGFIGPVRALR